MRWIDKLERKFGRFAVHNLMLYLLILQGIGYFLGMTNSSFYLALNVVNPTSLVAPVIT